VLALVIGFKLCNLAASVATAVAAPNKPLMLQLPVAPGLDAQEGDQVQPILAADACAGVWGGVTNVTAGRTFPAVFHKGEFGLAPITPLYYEFNVSLEAIAFQNCQPILFVLAKGSSPDIGLWTAEIGDGSWLLTKLSGSMNDNLPEGTSALQLTDGRVVVAYSLDGTVRYRVRELDGSWSAEKAADPSGPAGQLMPRLAETTELGVGLTYVSNISTRQVVHISHMLESGKSRDMVQPVPALPDGLGEGQCLLGRCISVTFAGKLWLSTRQGGVWGTFGEIGPNKVLSEEFKSQAWKLELTNKPQVRGEAYNVSACGQYALFTNGEPLVGSAGPVLEDWSLHDATHVAAGWEFTSTVAEVMPAHVACATTATTIEFGYMAREAGQWVVTFESLPLGPLVGVNVPVFGAPSLGYSGTVTMTATVYNRTEITTSVTLLDPPASPSPNGCGQAHFLELYVVVPPEGTVTTQFRTTIIAGGQAVCRPSGWFAASIGPNGYIPFTWYNTPVHQMYLSAVRR
jgi:hypothetical protein